MSFVVGCGPRPKPRSARPSPQTQALVDKAHSVERTRDYHRARRLYKEAIATAEDADSAAFANREMAAALLFWGEYDGAMDLLLESLKHDPAQAPVWHDLGILRSRAGRPQAAHTALAEAVRLAPQSPRSRVALAALLVQQKRYSEALAHYKRLLTLKLPSTTKQAVQKAIVLLNAQIKLQTESQEKI